MAHAEREIAAGRHADWPMVLAAQSWAGDPSRIGAQGRRPFWTYAHVPAGSSVDQAQTITTVMERFAPGFSDIVVGARSIPAADLHLHDANYVGGDIGVGGNSVLRALLGPTPGVNPWSTPVPRAYLCSSATPPGGGVHGMSGFYAARTVLKREFGLRVPSLRPALPVR
jgi:phytoene dehydrogenase-like protein